jgi:hypothetical protein
MSHYFMLSDGTLAAYLPKMRGELEANTPTKAARVRIARNLCAAEGRITMGQSAVLEAFLASARSLERSEQI